MLRRHFGEPVLAPIRLHVAAKRYLCAIDPDYRAELSAGSQRSLEMQGGRLYARRGPGFHRTALRCRCRAPAHLGRPRQDPGQADAGPGLFHEAS
jgi:predicted HD phosphohydrolase